MQDAFSIDAAVELLAGADDAQTACKCCPLERH